MTFMELGIMSRDLIFIIFPLFLLLLISSGNGSANHQIRNLVRKNLPISIPKCLEWSGDNIIEWKVPPWQQGWLSPTKRRKLESFLSNPELLFTFNFTPGPLTCRGRKTTDVFHQRSSPPYNEGKAIDPQFYWTFYGAARIRDIILPMERYCVQRLTLDEVEIQFCEPECRVDLCVEKICPEGQISRLNLTSGAVNCNETILEEWEPDVYEVTPEGALARPETNPVIFYFFTGDCDGEPGVKPRRISTHSLAPLKIKAEKIGVTRNGIFWRHPLTKSWQGTEGDFSAVDGVILDKAEHYDSESSNQLLVYCVLQSAAVGEELVAQTVFPYNSSSLGDKELANGTGNISQMMKSLPQTLFLSSGALFLLLAVIMYVITWRKINVNGWVIGAVCFFRLISIICMILEDLRHLCSTSRGCFILGFFRQFFLLSSLLWFMIYSVDTWRTLSSNLPTYIQKKGVKWFIGYSAVGIGVPLILTLVSLTIELTEPDGAMLLDYCHKVIKSSAEDALPYIMHVIVPATVFFIISCIFALLIFINYVRHEKDLMDPTRSNLVKDFSKVFPFVKLEWIIFVTLAVVDPGKMHFFYLWILFTAFVCLTSFVFMGVFVCNKRMKGLLKEDC